MAIYSGPSLIPGSRSGSVDLTFERHFTRLYRVITDEITDDEYVVTSSLDIAIYSAHPSDPFSLVTAIKVQEDPEQLILPTGGPGWRWTITVEYGPFNPLYYWTDGDPTTAPLRYHFDPEKYQEPCVLAYDQTNPSATSPTLPCVNVVGDLFNPGLERDTFRGTATVIRNEFSPDLPTLLTYSNCINVNAIWGFPAQTLKVEPISLPEEKYDQQSGVGYFEMVYTFAYNKETWVDTVYNTGRRQLVINALHPDGILVTILDDSAQPLDDPGFLSSAGAWLHPPVSPSSIVSLSFLKYQQIDFSVFGFTGLNFASP